MILGQILLFAMLGGGAGALHFVAIARAARLLIEGGSVPITTPVVTTWAIMAVLTSADGRSRAG